jgi:ubiquinone/menaquinone biosynthesis C-methylase UbiE
VNFDFNHHNLLANTQSGKHEMVKLSDIDSLSPYHRAELAIVLNKDDPRRSVPSFDCTDWSVLDVGCGSGQTLMAHELEKCAQRCGVDPDAQAIEAGRRAFPDLNLQVASAERLPFPDGQFDLTYSRVALLYTNIPAALREMRRVTKPGGAVWLALNGWPKERERLTSAFRNRSPRQLIDRGYVIMNSLTLQAIGLSFARPWSGKHESFQTERGMRALLQRMDFRDVAISNQGQFVATARKA